MEDELISYFQYRCPICGKSSCETNNIGMNKFNILCKTHNFSIILNRDIFGVDQIEENRRVNAAVLHKKKRNLNLDFEYYFDDRVNNIILDDNMINIYQLMFNYPKTFLERIESILLNLLEKSRSFNDEIVFDFICPAELYCDGDMIDEEKIEMGLTLEQMGYLKREIILNIPNHEEFV